MENNKEHKENGLYLLLAGGDIDPWLWFPRFLFDTQPFLVCILYFMTTPECTQNLDTRKTLEMRFGEEIMNLTGDISKDSILETLIFAEVFLAFKENYANKCNGAFDTSGFQLTEGSTSTNKASAVDVLQHEQLNLKNRSSSCVNSRINEMNRKQPEPALGQDLSFKDVAANHNLNVLRDESFKYKSLSKTLMCPDNFNSSRFCPKKLCLIVESFDQGIKYSYYAFDAGGVHYDLSAWKNSGKGQSHLISSLGCEENHTNMKLVPITPLLLKESPPSLACAGGTEILCKTPSSKTTDARGRRVLFTGLSSRLRSHAHHLLKDAGWKICLRKRVKGKTDAIYHPPGKGVLLYSLSKAWISCGVRLSAKSMNIKREVNGRTWIDINGFWCDLADILSFVEKGIQCHESSLTLLQRWLLLDPFVAVVCIDHKIHALLKGNAVKAVNSSTTVLSKSGSVFLLKGTVMRFQHDSSPYSSQHGLLSSAVSDSKVSALVSSTPNLKEKTINHKFRLVPLQEESIGGSNIRSLNKHKWEQLHDTCSNTQLVTHSKEKRLQQRIASLPKKVQLTCEGTLDVCAKKVDEKDSWSCCGFQRSKKAHELSFEESQRVERSLDCLAAQEKEVTQENMIALGSSHSCLFTVNQASQDQVAQQHNLSFYPEPGTLFVLMDNNGLRQPVLVHMTNNNTSISADIGSQMQPLIYQENVVAEVPIVKTKNNILHNEGFPVHREGPSPLLQECLDEAEEAENVLTEKEAVHRTSKKQRILGTSNCEIKPTSETPLVRKTEKKSKNISEIEAMKMDCKNSVTNSLNQNCVEFLALHGDEKPNSTSNCLKRSARLANTSNQTPVIGSRHATLAVDTNFSTKLQKKTLKVSVRTSKRYISRNKDCSINDLDDEGDTLLNGHQNNVPEGPERRSLIGDNNNFSMNSEKPTSSSCSHTKISEAKNIKDALNDTGWNCSNISSSVSRELNNEKKRMVYKIGILGNDRLPNAPKNLDDGKLGRTERSKGKKMKRQIKVHVIDDLLNATVTKRKLREETSIVKSSKSNALQKLRTRKLSVHAWRGAEINCVSLPGARRARTVLCWLVDMRVIHVNNTIQFREPKDNTVVKDGRVTKRGILCRCCKRTLSVSKFKVHAGYTMQKPCLNLFLRSGKSYTFCQLQAWSLEYRARKDAIPVMSDDEIEKNDNICGHCGDGGELICCDNCPNCYHQECLHSMELPEDRWYCPNCICNICGYVINTMDVSTPISTLQCSQCQRQYHEKCIEGISRCHGEAESVTWFCKVECQEVFLGLHSLLGVINYVGDGFSVTVLRCSHDNQKLQSTQKLAVTTECNIKLAIALSIMEESFLSMVDSMTGIDIIPHVLYNFGSKFARLNYEGFSTVVLEKNDELISVASIRVHNSSIAEMPLIATSYEHRRQGMCRLLLRTLEEMLKSLKVEVLVLPAIPTLVENWISVFGFKHVEDNEKWLCNINLMVFPGTILLKKELL